MHDYSMPGGTKKLRFRDWLKQKLDKREITGLEWIDRPQGLFKIPWKHGSLHGWSFLEDAEVFRQWAIHSGRYKTGMKPDPSKWKTNFRCTLNALPDFKEVKARSCTRGMKAHKIYVMKGGYRKAEQREKADGEQTEPLDLSDKEIIQMVDDMMGAPQKPILTRRPNSAFETLVVDKPRALYSVSLTPWYLAAWNALAVDQYVNKPEDKGVMAQPDIKQEPLSPGDRMTPSCSQEIDLEEGASDSPKVIAKEEDDVPNDQEIIDLVDRMSEQSDSSLEDMDGMDGTNEEEDDVQNDQEIIDLVDRMSEQSDSSLEDMDGMNGTNEEGFAQGHSDKSERPPLRLVMKTEGSSTFVDEYAASLPLTPDSTREILNAISRY